MIILLWLYSICSFVISFLSFKNGYYWLAILSLFFCFAISTFIGFLSHKEVLNDYKKAVKIQQNRQNFKVF